MELSEPKDKAKEFKPSIERDLMDFELDLDFGSSWTFDPIPFTSNPSSPQNLHQLQLPSVGPSSPLWVFPDEASAAAEDISVIFSCNKDPVNGNIALENNKRKPSHAPAIASMTEAENSDGSSAIKEKMMQALRYFKESTEQHVLVQVWAPVKNGDQYVLTTSEQPFVLDPHSSGLRQYRMASVTYMFSLDGDGNLGIPGRVFRQKWPEWSPNVQYYSSKEYPRLNDALHYNVRGTFALPVFDPSRQSCVGVVELIMTAEKINYASEVNKVCKALEAVNLKSSEILDHPHRQICSEGRQAALAEIFEILTVVCETHKLPLAQTWVPCRHQSVLAYGSGSKKSCTSFDGSCMGQVCMSTTDVAFYVVDAHMWRFRDACAEHHLQKGQGVAGRAFLEHRACFSQDITQFSKMEYPLVHYARIFGLLSCLAVCLRSTHTGSDDYILEFFLPPNCRDSKGQQTLLDSLLDTMKQCFQSVRAITEGNLPEEGSLEVIEKTINEKLDMNLEHNQSINCEQTIPETKTSQGLDNLLNERDVSPDMLGQQLMNEVGVQMSNKEPANVDGNLTRNKSIRKRGKTEKSISLEVLRQYFAGNLKDAAKSLGVCPTTMKRICRQHGITRWPSRKINKVNRSLTKLKRVIESVQGAEGAFSLSSLASNPLPVAIGSTSCPVNLNGPDQNLAVCKPSDLQAERGTESPPCKTQETNNHDNIHQELSHERSVFQSVPVEGFNGFKTGSCSGEESTDTPISQSSCQNSPANETDLNNPHVSSIQEVVDISSSLGFPFQPTGGEINMPAEYPVPEALVTTQTQPRTLLNTMLVEDTGSCKDLRDLCNSKAECCQDEQAAAQITKDTESMTIKAVYKQDIIRFRLPVTSGAADLNQEVAKRLKLEVGTYDIKYMDDDQEWVLLVCDADLQECMEISRSSSRHMIRLLVHDVVSNLGSSCESSGEV